MSEEQNPKTNEIRPYRIAMRKIAMGILVIGLFAAVGGG